MKEIKKTGLFSRINWLDVYFVAVTAAYLAWRIKVLLERIHY